VSRCDKAIRAASLAAPCKNRGGAKPGLADYYSDFGGELGAKPARDRPYLLSCSHHHPTSFIGNNSRPYITAMRYGSQTLPTFMNKSRLAMSVTLEKAASFACSMFSSNGTTPRTTYFANQSLTPVWNWDGSAIFASQGFPVETTTRDM
jgi:hypothetical protein